MREKREAKLSEREPEFSADMLTSLFEQTSKTIIVPSPQIMRLLAAQLNLVRRQFEVRFENERLYYNHNKAAQEAIPALIAALKHFRPQVEGSLNLFKRSAAPPSRDDFEAELHFADAKIGHECFLSFTNAIEAGDRVLADLETIQTSGKWFVPVVAVEFTEAWPQVIDEVFDLIRDALKPSNEGLGFGKTKGVVNNILSRLVQHITGEQPTPAAIDSYRRGKG